MEEKGGDVFELSKKDSLVRIENSNIKNFLIGSAIFIKKDTLFRHGGYGYWSQSNFFTYLAEQTEEFRIEKIGDNRYSRLTVPPGIWFGFQGLTSGYSLLMNVIDLEHDPDEVLRKETSEFDYDWSGE